MITKKEYKTLQKYTSAFNYATKSNCIPAFTKGEIDEMEIIYNGLGEKLASRKCGHCLLTMVQKLANEFYNYEKELSTQRNRQQQEPKQTSKSKDKVGSEETIDSSGDC